jgi:hypothetical protein
MKKNLNTETEVSLFPVHRTTVMSGKSSDSWPRALCTMDRLAWDIATGNSLCIGDHTPGALTCMSSKCYTWVQQPPSSILVISETQSQSLEAVNEISHGYSSFVSSQSDYYHCSFVWYGNSKSCGISELIGVAFHGLGLRKGK